jgi:hypothetical protein
MEERQPLLTRAQEGLKARLQVPFVIKQRAGKREKKEESVGNL